MTFLITGANGQLGQDIQALLKSEGKKLIGTDIQGPYESLDITDIKSLRSFVKNKNITVIINCAAYNAVDKAETDSYLAFLINGIGTRNLATVSREIGADFVHYSTDYVFDGKKSTPYTILDRPSPVSKYGESKFLGEIYTTNSTSNYYLIRTSWVFGKGNINWAKKVIEWSKEKDKLTIVDDEISCPTYTKDLAKGTIDLIKSNIYGLYHITNSSFCSRFDWAKLILDEINWKGELIRGKLKDFVLPAQRPGYSVLDSFGTKETIGYSLPSWQDATRKFLKEVEF